MKGLCFCLTRRLYSEEINFFLKKKSLSLLVGELDYLSQDGVAHMQAFLGTDLQGPPLRLRFLFCLLLCLFVFNILIGV